MFKKESLKLLKLRGPAPYLTLRLLRVGHVPPKSKLSSASFSNAIKPIIQNVFVYLSYISSMNLAIKIPLVGVSKEQQHTRTTKETHTSSSFKKFRHEKYTGYHSYIFNILLIYIFMWD